MNVPASIVSRATGAAQRSERSPLRIDRLACRLSILVAPLRAFRDVTRTVNKRARTAMMPASASGGRFGREVRGFWLSSVGAAVEGVRHSVVWMGWAGAAWEAVLYGWVRMLC